MIMLIKFNISLFIFGLITSCSSYSRDNSYSVKKDTADIYQILYYASLAGSSHNSQPWRVEVYGNDSLLVFADMSRKLPVVDPEARELFISIGAFIENLDIAAASFGYLANIKVNTLAKDGTMPIAFILFVKAKKEHSNLKEIELRCTLRAPFDTIALKDPDWRTLTAIDSLNIHYLPGTSEKGKFVKQKILEAYTKQAYKKEAQEELAKWIRFSNKDVKNKQDGLTTSGMGIKGLNGFIVRNFFVPDDSKKESFVTKGIEKTKQQVENCGGWILITQNTSNIESFINTGRLYQRINLKCRKLMLGFQPMNQIIEEPDFENEANTFLSYQGRIIFVARIGYVKDYPEPVSVRRPVESFTKFE
jgi:hypothetical protein